jgi:phosphate transport system permease protein
MPRPDSSPEAPTEPSSTKPKRRAAPIMPERFRVARPTLLFDRFMNQFIKIGGISIIAAVFAIFVFILLQIIPLFRGASVTEESTVSVGDIEVVAMGSDEWVELPFFVTADGRVRLLDLAGAGTPHDRGWFELETGFPPDVSFSTIRYNARSSNILFGTTDGRFSAARISYRASFPERGGREILATLTPTPLIQIGREGHPIEDLAYGDSGSQKLAGAIQRVDGRPELYAVALSQRRTLLGLGPLQVENRYDLTEHLPGEPAHLLIGAEADSVVVATTTGAVTYIFYSQGEFSLRQNFRPFADLDDPSIARMDFVLGDVSIVFSHPSGQQRVFSLFPDPETGRRVWGQTKNFSPMPAAPEFFSAGMRNKSFLVGTGDVASLRYMTTENIRWQEELPFTIAKGILAPRYDRILLLDTENILHILRLYDPHPQASWKTYFGRIHYEGRSEPAFIWQSTGGTDDFERKLSMVPLIIGTLKGTVYALLFALPIALLAALYTSQFLRPELKRVVKPTMEIMASLPSVVLGFLAALWLAPIVSNRIPSVLLGIIGIVAGAFIAGWAWNVLPRRIRLRMPEGYEFLLVLPVMFIFSWGGWQLGPVMERIFFVVTDPETGLRVADFRLWFPTVTGLGFEQRNAAVVGFVMGFAVIPIIFTISEDAMANVPASFRSGSLALGASRWQTAIRVVLPTASAGIFSAVMIGLGRAVGETMIVVMATGNTPVTSFNIFTGMRTLSANIAVELPEAPYLGTLYRTLFLGAMILFILTFAVNTIAEILRQRLRERYRAVE